MSMVDNVIPMPPGRGGALARRDAEPKSDLRRILPALAEGIGRAAGEHDLQAIFEQQLQELLSIRSVRLREIPRRHHARLPTPMRTSESIVLGVPTSDPRVEAVL